MAYSTSSEASRNCQTKRKSEDQKPDSEPKENINHQ